MPPEDTYATLRILEMVESGTISPEEGIKLLEALKVEHEDPITSESPPESLGVSRPSDQEPVLVSSAKHGPASIPPGAEKWRLWWQIPLWIGAGITIVGGFLMYLALQNQGVGFWFFCAWLPFLLGVIAMAIGWYSRTARWLHVRIHEAKSGGSRRIAISFPLPIRLTAWFLRNFGRFIPQLDQTGLDELILALGENATPETPLYVEVDEGEDGDRVEVFIG